MIVLEFQSSRLVGGRLIQLLTNSPYNHVGLCCADGERTMDAKAFKGVTKRPMDRKKQDRAFYIYDVDPEGVFEKASACLGRGYDYTSILSWFGRSNNNTVKRLYCTEYMNLVTDLVFWEPSIKVLTPRDLLTIKPIGSIKSGRVLTDDVGHAIRQVYSDDLDHPLIQVF